MCGLLSSVESKKSIYICLSGRHGFICIPMKRQFLIRRGIKIVPSHLRSSTSTSILRGIDKLRVCCRSISYPLEDVVYIFKETIIIMFHSIVQCKTLSIITSQNNIQIPPFVVRLNRPFIGLSKISNFFIFVEKSMLMRTEEYINISGIPEFVLPSFLSEKSERSIYSITNDRSHFN